MGHNDESAVQLDRYDDIAVVTLNRPKARNAINYELASEFVEAIRSAQDAGCIIIIGADPAFCAGMDLRDIGVGKLKDTPSYADALRSSEVPLIAAVNGAAITGGLEIALGCDFIVASERALFADTHLRVGVFPGPVLVDLPRRVGMAQAREMSLTGNFVDAATSLRIGLANHVVPHENLLPFTMGLAKAIAEQDGLMVRAMREDWNATMGLPVAGAHQMHNLFRENNGYADGGGEIIAARRDAALARAREQRAARADGDSRK